MKQNNAKDEIEFISDIMKDAFWGVFYHEGELRSCHKRLAIAKSAAAMAGVDVSKITADDYHEEEQTNAIEFIEQAVADVLNSIKWQEQQLCEAHANVALAKAMILRGKFDIDIEQVEAKAKKRYEEKA
jgi:hypothetical protein